VKVADVLLTGDVLRLAGVGGDEAVEALSEMANGDRARISGAADRQVQIDQWASRIVAGDHDRPPRARLPAEHRVGSIVGDAA
jgi:hypothetical protein